ncbi:MAG: response regulator [Candidatus Eisenbacteria bacterium]
MPNGIRQANPKTNLPEIAPDRVKVLILMEDEDYAGFLMEVMAEPGRIHLQPFLARQLRSALDRLSGDGFDIVLVDSGPSESDTLDTIKAIHGRAEDLPVVVLVGLMDEPRVAALLNGGAEEYLLKEEVTPHGLRSTIGRIVNHRMALRALSTAAEAAPAAERGLQAIVGCSADGIVVVDGNGTIRFANPAAESLLGREADVLRGSPFGFPVVAGETTEIEILRPNKPRRVAEIRVAEMVWEDETSLLATLRDITDRRQIEDDLRTSRDELAIRNKIANAFLTAPDDEVYGEVLRLFAESMESPVGFLGFINEDGTVVELASIGAPLEKQDPESTIRMIPSGELEGMWAQAIDRHKPTCSNSAPILPEVHRDVSRAIAAPLNHHNRAIGIVGLADKPEDYTAREMAVFEVAADQIAPILNARLREKKALMQAEAEKNKMHEELARTREIEATTAFAGKIAKDFYDLLAGIKGHVSLMTMRIDGDSQLRRDLGKMHDASVSATNLTHQMLLFSGTAPTRREPADLNQIVHDTLGMLTYLTGQDITVHAKLDTYLCNTSVARADIAQAITNLVDNAASAAGRGGHITVQTENVKLSESEAEMVADARPGSFLCLSVTDDGPGMDKETIGHIFHPFFTTHNSHGTAGLGLSVVRGIARQHEGWVEAYSQPGNGSTFNLYLPALTVPEAEGSLEDTPAEEIRGRHERILVVEDEEPIREFIVTVLRDQDYTVLDAGSAEDAMTIFEAEKGEFDLLFSDVVLPGQDGVQLAEHLKLLRPGLRILLTSGYLDENTQWVIECEKGFGFLHKPFALKDLLNDIRTALDCETPTPAFFATPE